MIYFLGLLLVVYSHAAVSYGHIPLLKFLLSVGANPNLKDNDGDTPLHVCESAEVAELLLASGADPLLLNNENQSIFDVAFAEENEEMANYLISKNLHFVSAPQESTFDDDDDDNDDDNDDDVII